MGICVNAIMNNYFQCNINRITDRETNICILKNNLDLRHIYLEFCFRRFRSELIGFSIIFFFHRRYFILLDENRTSVCYV